jgi:hypothetical protein
MDCSASWWARRAGRAVGSRLSVLLSIGFLGLSVAHADDAAELEDAAARAQYAFFTNDVRALQDVLAMLANVEFEQGLAARKEYVLAYGQWKLAQLHSQRAQGSSNRSEGASAAKACVEHARATLKQDPRMAEAHALQAICEGKPNSFVGRAGLDRGSCERHRAMREALMLAPQNPRVQLIGAMCTRPLAPNEEVERWRGIVNSFDKAPRPQSGSTDWGYAEALTLLAEALLNSGAHVPARDAAEKALVVAPDYESARAVLQLISSQSK